MKRFFVRVWVDLEVKGVADRAAALAVAKRHPVNVVKNDEAELYEMQVSGDVWEREDEPLVVQRSKDPEEVTGHGRN